MGTDDQGGFNWTITFTSDNQDGDLPLITVETDALTASETLIEVSNAFLSSTVQLRCGATAELKITSTCYRFQ